MTIYEKSAIHGAVACAGGIALGFYDVGIPTAIVWGIGIALGALWVAAVPVDGRLRRARRIFANWDPEGLIDRETRCNFDEYDEYADFVVGRLRSTGGDLTKVAEQLAAKMNYAFHAYSDNGVVEFDEQPYTAESCGAIVMEIKMAIGQYTNV